MNSHIGVTMDAVEFCRELKEAGEREKLAFEDIETYIERNNADFDNVRVAAYWLDSAHQGDARFSCVLFLMPYNAGAVYSEGRRIYIAIPQSLFGVNVEEYTFGGDVAVIQNEELFLSSRNPSMSGFRDIMTFYEGALSQIYEFQDSETQYKKTFGASVI